MIRRGHLSFCVLAAVGASLWAHAPVAAAQTAFEDVADGAFYAEPVAALDAGGVFSGTLCTEGFCPGEPIDRKTMAVWVVRVLDGADPPAASQTVFDDVDADSFHAPFIERMRQLEVTSGCGDGSGFCPHDNVSRAEMAVFLSRAFELPDGPDPDFADVGADAWYAAEVAMLAASGITRGCRDGSRFCPSQETTRGEMATFLWRGQNLDKQQQAPGQYTAISVGDQNVCAITTDSTIVCWNLDPSPPPDCDQPEWQQFPDICAQMLREGAVLEPPHGQFTDIDVGLGHACAIRTDGTAVCWGDNTDGQLEVPDGRYTAIDVDNFARGCALRTDQTVACWGRNGDELTEAINRQGRFTAISAEEDRACAIRTDNSAVCVLDPDSIYVEKVYEIEGRFTAIDSGCRLQVDSTAVCDLNVDTPGEFTAISMSLDQFCGIRTDKTLYCATPHGPFGSPSFYPHDYSPDGQFAAVSGGLNVACGIKTDQTVVCWGPGTTYSSGDYLSLNEGVQLPEGVQIALPPPWNTTEIWAAEDEMARLVNELRRSLGLAPLTVYKELRTVARAWSVTMRDRDIFEHNPNYTLYYPQGWTRVGENIAYNSASGRTIMDAVQVAFDGLADSPGHYANMTNPEFNSLGVGIAAEGSSFWFTQNFAHYP